jgi:lysophospholipase L1-like esterase
VRIALFGDSQGGGLARHLEEILDGELVFVATRDGLSTSRFLDEVAWQDAADAEPDLLLVVLGGNDFPNRSYPAVLERAVDRFSDITPNIVWIGPSASRNREVSERHDATRIVQSAVLPRLGVTYLDPRSWQVGAAEQHTPDGTHFTRSAYALQAGAIAERLRAGLPWGWIAAAVALTAGAGLALAFR